MFMEFFYKKIFEQKTLDFFEFLFKLSEHVVEISFE